MIKKASVIIEGILVFFVVLCCFFIALPFMFNTTQKEHNIVKWAQKYSNIEYTYKILKVQTEETDKKFMSSNFQNKLNEFIREKNSIKGEYKQKFLHSNKNIEIYVFDKFFETENGTIIGFKWINPNCKNKEICATMSVDINGLKKPNTWGKDVYGVNFLIDKVEPAGYGFNMQRLRQDCTKGSGVYCSAYYLIGGLFIK